MLVDGGDFTGSQNETGEPRGFFLLEMMNRFGYDAIGLGMNDLLFGRQMIKTLVSEGSAPFVSANVRDAESGRPLAPAWRIVERAGARVGITAVLELGAPRARRLSDAGYTIDPAEETLARVLPEVRERSDVVVLLAGMPLGRAEVVGKRFEGLVDVVIVGNHRPGRGLVHPDESGTLYVTADGRGQSLGLARLRLEGSRVDRMTGDELVLNRRWAADPEVVRLVEEFTRNLNELMRSRADRRVEERAATDGHYFVGALECASCHHAEYELWTETPHASAFETLVREGKDALPECFRCHVTGHDVPGGYVSGTSDPTALINVQCEVCHDRGSLHARDGTYGRSLGMRGCTRCHDAENSPDFDPEIYWLMIEH